ncbi:hypothetical protein QYM36_016247 [Artemia franciscana]|uniref:Reverse transcriptase domain-containing protein n=1 Tax=Artemia franciscana TaxID=6661 RepID=A0AA88HFN8_ARTSF|nr:hypothetical protein QYM36_016247 [Artemia franciscana]
MEKKISKLNLPNLKTLPTEDAIKEVTEKMIEAGKKHQAIKGSQGIKKKTYNSTPGWTAKCEAIKKKRRDLRNQLKKRWKPGNINISVSRLKAEIHKVTAQLRLTVKEERYKAWTWVIHEKFRGNIPARSLWRNFKKYIKRETYMCEPKLLQMGRQQAFEDAEKVEILADQFENTSKRSRRQGNNNFNKATPDSYKHWNNYEKEPLLNLRDIQRAVSELKSGATGNDRVHNNMLKALPIETMQIILELFNKSLNQGVVPQIWKHAIIHPILKPGKDPKDPASYRPISLLSCLAKLLERAIKAKNKKALKGNIQIEQCGFYEGRSTTETLIRLEHHVKKGFLKKRHTCGIFFYAKAAFDKVNIEKLKEKIQELKVDRRYSMWLQEWITSRTFSVRIKRTLSTIRNLESGFPQGGVLSALLFSLYISDLNADNLQRAKIYLYADDLAVTVEGQQREEIQTYAQKAAIFIEQWAAEKEIIPPEEKTTMMMFTSEKRQAPDPDIFLNGLKIRCTESVRYLGVLLDSQLNWEKHIEKLITAVDRRQMLINAICNKKYEVPWDVLMQFSKAIILGKIDYASLVYASAKKTILAKLNAKWNETLRRTTNALKSTPIPALHIETSMTSLPTRRKILMAKYLLKKRGTEQEDIIKNEIIMDPYLMDYRFEIHNKPSLVKLLKDFPTNMSPLTIPTDKTKKIEGLERNISWKIHEEIGHKSGMSEQSLLQFALSELENYSEYRKFFTDGSEIGSRTGCGIWDDYEKLGTQHRLSDHTSIYMAELFAIDTEIKEIVREGNEGKYLVYTDSLSCLKYLKVAHEQAPTMARDIAQNKRMIEETGSCYETARSRLKEQVEKRDIQFRIKELLGKVAKNKQREKVKYLGQYIKDTGLIDVL